MIVHGEGERFVVSEIDGWEIGRDGKRGNRSRTVTVLDSHDCYREVERVPTYGPNGHTRGSVKKRGIARTACDKLNREHMRAALEDAPPLDLDYYAELAELHRKRLALILWMRDVQHRSTRDIATRLGITVQRVNQLLRSKIAQAAYDAALEVQAGEGTGSS